MIWKLKAGFRKFEFIKFKGCRNIGHKACGAAALVELGSKNSLPLGKGGSRALDFKPILI